MTEVTPDPKPEYKKGNKQRRIIDPKAIHRAKLMYPECAACGMPGSNGHHVVPKDKGGDDVVENIVSLCGTGTSRCHGAHHGNPYTVVLVGQNQRRDAEWVNRLIGQTLMSSRPDVVEYTLRKLGRQAGAEYLHRTYKISTLPR